jgi:PD-(D/E)XK nuclease superfamily
MEAICRYYLRYSARETMRYLTRRFHIKVPVKTFRLWHTAHKLICTYHTIREDFAYFRARGFIFLFGDNPITGHIDFLQLRAGFLHTLDYKPEARKEKHAVTQLTIYALAMSRRTGLQLKAFKCAWFDERDSCEFFPLPAIYRRP